MSGRKESSSPRRGRRGEGTIYWDKTKRCWVGEISVGYTADGKRLRPKVYGTTKTEVREELRRKRREHESGVTSSARYTVAEAARDWLTTGLKGRSKASLDVYLRLVDNHIVPGLGKRVLHELTADDVDAWLEARTSTLATSTLRLLLGMLRRTIRHAQRRGKVVRNVAELVDPTTGTGGRPSKSLTFDQARAVVAAARPTPMYAYIVLSLTSGMRTEEARMLTWDRVHLDPPDGLPPHVEVWRSVRDTGDTKTKKSRRTIALPDVAVDALRRHYAQQEQQKARGPWRDTNRVFCSETGEPLSDDQVRKDFRRVLKDTDLEPDEWTPRELRHTFTSLLSAKGVRVEDIAHLLGHSTTTTTETIYRKELRPVLTRGAEVLGELFNEPDSDT